MDKTSSDKRKHERFSFGSGNPLWNLSEGGAYVVTQSPRHLGSIIHFEFKLGPEAQAFQALGKVVRILHRPVPQTNEPAGMAIQFTRVSDDDRVRLRAFLEQEKQFAARRKTDADKSLPKAATD